MARTLPLALISSIRYAVRVLEFDVVSVIPVKYEFRLATVCATLETCAEIELTGASGLSRER